MLRALYPAACNWCKPCEERHIRTVSAGKSVQRLTCTMVIRCNCGSTQQSVEPDIMELDVRCQSKAEGQGGGAVGRWGQSPCSIVALQLPKRCFAQDRTDVERDGLVVMLGRTDASGIEQTSFWCMTINVTGTKTRCHRLQHPLLSALVCQAHPVRPHHELTQTSPCLGCCRRRP